MVHAGPPPAGAGESRSWPRNPHARQGRSPLAADAPPHSSCGNHGLQAAAASPAVRRPGPAGLPLPTIESPQCLFVTALRTRPAQAPFKRPCLRTRTAPATSLPGLAPPGTSMCLCVACFIAPCASPAPGSFPIIPRQVLSVAPGHSGQNALQCSGAQLWRLPQGPRGTGIISRPLVPAVPGCWG